MDAGDGTMITIKRVTLTGLSGSGSIAQSTRSSDVNHAIDPVETFWPRLSDTAEVYAALVTGTRDYVRKNGFRSVIIALSGGIDSALTATIAGDAIGADNVHVVLMPSRYSTDHSISDAEDLVERQGCTP